MNPKRPISVQMLCALLALSCWLGVAFWPAPIPIQQSNTEARTQVSVSNPCPKAVACPCPQHAANASPVLKVERPAPGSQRIATAPLIALRQSTPGTRVSFSLFGQTLDAQVLQSKPADSLGNWLLMLKLPSLENATLSLWQDERYGLGGMIHNASGSVAYKIEATGDASQWVITPCKIQDLICGTSPEVGLPGTHAMQDNPEAALAAEFLPQAEPTPQTLDLQSLPGSPNVLYLDFDGEFVTNTSWNSFKNVPEIDAQASIFNTDAAIRYLWHAVSQDYSTFNLSVTTSRAVYDATPASKRMMVIFTDTKEWYGSVSGVAYTNSFGSSVNWCCWVFTSEFDSVAFKANTASHESGHTLGLSHDGLGSTEYYQGHSGDFSYSSWRPIMGTLTRNLVTWDQGDYASASNTEKDLQLIENQVGRLTDENPGSISLPLLSDHSVSFEGSFRLATNNVPELSDDFTFYSVGGAVQLHARHYGLNLPDPSWSSTQLLQSSNLDLRLQLLDANDQVVLSDEGLGKRDATLSGTIPSGLYKVKILTTAAPEPTYYSTYGQLGTYSIVGNVPAAPGLSASPSSLILSTSTQQSLPQQLIQLTANGMSSGSFSVESSAPWLIPSLSSGEFVNSQANLSLAYQLTGLPSGTHQASLKITSPTAPVPFYLNVTLQLSSSANSSGITINDNAPASPYPSNIELANVPGTIESIKVRFNGFSHEFPRDVRALLISPSGKKIMLMDNLGGSSGVNQVSFSFDDAGSQMGTTLTPGAVYRPTGTSASRSSMPSPAPAVPYSNSFSSLLNDPIAGTWSLYLSDAANQDLGQLDSWSLEFTLKQNQTLLLTSYAKPSSDSHQIQFSSAPGKLYVIEASDSLKQWSEVRRVTATSSNTQVVFTRAEQIRQFYRIRLLP